MGHKFKPSDMMKLDSLDRKKIIPPDVVLKFMNVQQGDTLLDIGAGIGYFAIPALDYVGDTGRVIAADISIEMLDELKRRVKEQQKKEIQCVLCTEDGVAISEKSADKILLAFVFHEIENSTAYLQEIKKYLKCSGELTIVEWERKESPMGPPLTERISRNDLEGMMLKNGFTVIKSEMVNEFQYAVNIKINNV
jgi:FkbM family methyltransferase